MRLWRRPRAKVVPGELCPALLVNSRHGQAVQAVRYYRHAVTGIMERCPRCGFENVRLVKFLRVDGTSSRDIAWHFEPHIVPIPAQERDPQ